MNTLVFDFPPGWRIGLPLAALALALAARALRRRGLGRGRVLGMTALRAVALLSLVFLVSKPMWVAKAPPSQAVRPVVLLVDRSESMSLEEGDKSRYRQALDFARDHLLPALKAADVPVQALLFAEDAVPADGARLNAELPKGKRTNLGGAIARAFASTPATPLAVIALTDGVVNESADNARALTALVEARAPFVGVGFGTDLGARTLSLRQVEAPPVVATNTLFRVTAHLEMQNSEETPPFDLVLMREGQVAQRKTVNPGKGSRVWLESFDVSEATEGTRVFAVQFLPPSAPGLKCVNTMGSTTVLVANEKELRVLYVQGALTWDYKFFALALKGDPTIKLTGLTRTSKQSVFRQNVETAGELKSGFPTTTTEIAPFRAVILANLTPLDLSPAQQELLARYCGELGGGVLMIGGPATFNLAWRGSRLEQMMPVTFAAGLGVAGLDRPFRLRLTEDALQHPLFQIANDRTPRETWAQLPPFNQYGRVDGAKAGAQIWAEHPEDEGPKGKRILMASQRFGAGVSAAICLQNLWRWRLAKDGEPAQFDRFWRQMIRFLSEPSRQEVLIQLADQELHPQMDVQLTVEKKPRASDIPGARQVFTMVVEDDLKKTVATQTLELTPGRAVEMSFHAERAGLYAVKALDANGVSVASRVVEIRDVNLEFADTGRNLETLRQWASMSDGLALKVEDCPDAGELVAQIRKKVEEARRFKPLRKPVGVNGWVLAAVLVSLGGEWVLRKKWSLV